MKKLHTKLHNSKSSWGKPGLVLTKYLWGPRSAEAIDKSVKLDRYKKGSEIYRMVKFYYK